MSYYAPNELREWYIQQSRYPAQKRASEDPPFIQWPHKTYFERFESDTLLLQRALSPVTRPTYSMADRVFGEQKRHEYTSLLHTRNLLRERSELHKQHLQDMDHRHRQIQEKLFLVKINNSPDQARRQSTLETQLLQLEQQRRDEDLAFWKDTVELREKLFEGATAYKEAKRRYSVFSDVEAHYDR